MAERSVPPEGDLAALLEFAVEVAEAAGPIALRYFRAPLDVQNKLHGGGFDPVTLADREVEAFLRGEIQRRFPDHGIIGEELGTTHGRSVWRWIIDPIDGTRAFISGSTAWGTLLGLMHGDRPVAGVVHVPYLRETFYAGTAGAWMKRDGELRPLRARPGTALPEAILYCTHPATFTDKTDLRAFERVARQCRMLRYGGDCYSYCMLALGQLDLIIEGSLQPYDIIPIMPIVTAAGAVISGPRGEPAEQGGLVVTAANAALHRQALELMNG